MVLACPNGFVDPIVAFLVMFWFLLFYVTRFMCTDILLFSDFCFIIRSCLFVILVCYVFCSDVTLYHWHVFFFCLI